MSTDPSLLDEHVLRRALRLDSEEMPPRLEPAFIAAAARASRSRVSAGILAASTVAFAAGWLWSEVLRALVGVVLASTGVDPLGLLIDLLYAALVQLAPLAQAAAAPVVPIAIFVAAAMAAFFEHRKGRTDATST